MEELAETGNFAVSELAEMVRGYILDHSCDFTLKGPGLAYRAKALAAVLPKALEIWDELCPDIRPFDIRMCHASAGIGKFALLVRFAFDDEKGEQKALVVEAKLSGENVDDIAVWNEATKKKYTCGERKLIAAQK